MTVITTVVLTGVFWTLLGYSYRPENVRELITFVTTAILLFLMSLAIAMSVSNA